MLAEGQVQVGMSSKPVSDDDRKKYPQCDFREIHVGEDAVALIVSKDVWDGGVRTLTKAQAKDIYESRITNWKESGSTKPQRIAFLNKEPGRGTWEVFVHWIYGSPKAAPQVSFPEVGGDEETRNKVGSTRGAMSQLSSSWADGKKVFALALVGEDGKASRTDRSEHRDRQISDEPPAFPAHQWRAERRREDARRFHARRARPGAGEKTRLPAAEGLSRRRARR